MFNLFIIHNLILNDNYSLFFVHFQRVPFVNDFLLFEYVYFPFGQ